VRTNIVIDDQLMADVMASGDFKTKKEAVEEGLRLLKRRKVYEGLLALRGQLQWDDSDEAWAKAGEEAFEDGAHQESVVQEAAVAYQTKPAVKARQPQAAKKRSKPGQRSKAR
jgi:antitoxin ParD1/3/4